MLKKIVLFGPESAGKTTLCEQLSVHFKTVWAPEFARDYLQKKWDIQSAICTPNDIVPIINGQLNLERKLEKKATNFIFYDTNILQTKVYTKIYFQNFECPQLEESLLLKNYDYYLLVKPDIPWVKDDLRDRPQDRESLFQLFENELKHRRFLYHIVSGKTKEERLLCAINHIKSVFST